MKNRVVTVFCIVALQKHYKWEAFKWNTIKFYQEAIR